MMPSIATKFQYVNSPFFIFPSYSLHVSAPRISNIEQQTSQKEETETITGVEKKGPPQLADRPAGQKDRRTAHTIIRGYKRLLTLNF
jgi:hypothetical protein